MEPQKNPWDPRRPDAQGGRTNPPGKPGDDEQAGDQHPGGRSHNKPPHGKAPHGKRQAKGPPGTPPHGKAPHGKGPHAKGTPGQGKFHKQAGGPQAGGAPPTDWGDVAEWYDQLVGEEGSEYQRHVVLPGILRMLAMQAGERALDVGCGQGVLCRILHRLGVQVTGIDAAAELIHIARERSEPAIQYLKADARELDILPAARFDAAACMLAIQNIHPLAPVFRGVSRCLRPLGRLVIVMMHPCFRAPKATSWGWDDKAHVQYRRVERYLLPRKEPIYTHPGSDPTHYTWTFHRPLQAYAKDLRHAGLLIDAIEEWPSHKTSEGGPRGAAENLCRKEIPMFLALRAVKVEGYPPAGGPAEAERT